MTSNEFRAIPISFFRHKTLTAEPRDITLGQVLDAIRGPFYEMQIKTIRQLKANNKEIEAGEVKNNLHAVTFCATFPNQRRSSMFGTYNNLMVLDIDKLPSEDMDRVAACLEDCPYVAAYWKSPSGAGYKGLTPLNYLHDDKKIDVVDKHHWAFQKLEQRFKEEYNIELDSSGKDITRLCFMSWCPELRLKEEFSSFDLDLDEMTAAVKERRKRGEILPVLSCSGEPIQWNLVDGQKQGSKSSPYDRRTLERIYKFLSSRHLSITSTYEEWVKVAFAIAQTFHSTYGRKMFMKLCELDGANHNEAQSERLIYDAYTTSVIRSDFSTIIFLANRKGFDK